MGSGGVLATEFSRRRLLRGAGAVGAAAAGMVIVGCSSSKNNQATGAKPASGSQQGVRTATPQAAQAAAIQPGGVYQDYTTTDITSMDPIAATANIDRTEAGYVYSRLFKWKPGIGKPATGEIEGDIVESYELNPNVPADHDEAASKRTLGPPTADKRPLSRCPGHQVQLRQVPRRIRLPQGLVPGPQSGFAVHERRDARQPDGGAEDGVPARRRFRLPG